MQTASVQAAALELRRRGWSVFPCLGKRAAVPWKEYQGRLPTEEEVTAWWDTYPEANVAVALGRVSNLVRVDADCPAALTELNRLGGVPETLEFTTPSGGRGWLFQYTEGVITEVLWSEPGEHRELRVQSDGAYTVVPPSPGWQWVLEREPASVPRWLRDRNVERVLRDLERELRPTLRQPEHGEVLEALSHIPSEDYDMWVQVGMALKSLGDEYMDTWDKWSKTSTKYRAGECERKWLTFRTGPGGLTARSILYWAEQADGFKLPNRHEPLTDLGNARILARMGDGSIKHSAYWGWLAWDGTRWSRGGDAEKFVVELQKKSMEYRLNQAVDSLSRHLRTDHEAEGFEAKKKSKLKAVSMIRAQEDEHHMRGSRSLAESDPLLSTDYRRFDAKPYYFNCANGTLDLETGEFFEHSSSHLLTQLCPTEYVPGAEAPRWHEFLEQILPDEPVRRFVQQFFGACLTGDVSVQVMPVFWGGGSNGKSTMINTVMHVLGQDYSMKAKRDLLMLKRGMEHPTSLARLHGKRFVACVESSEDGRLDETMVKELTGGDRIAARRMREDEWEFAPTHKPILVTNHRPEVRGTDDAIWRRLPLVPFTVQFPEGDPRRDPSLPDKLKQEVQGILQWMVLGCVEWLSNDRKLDRPDVVRKATAAYRDEQDRIGMFIADRCTVGEELKCRTDKLMEAYAVWCTINKHVQLNGNAFGRALSERGFPLECTGSKFRLGIDLQVK